MIYDYEVEAKDFSSVLSANTLRLTAIAESLKCNLGERDPIDNKVMEGFGYCIEDVTDELETVYETLYGSGKAPTEKAKEANETGHQVGESPQSSPDHNTS